METLSPVPKHFPKVLVLRPSDVFTVLENKFSGKFEFLKAWEFPIPTDQFLSTHATSVEAMFCSANTSVTAAVLRPLPSLSWEASELG
ncbi:hypothetical protein CsSME_00012599 [Camellia sinensis var. sinensis]